VLREPLPDRRQPAQVLRHLRGMSGDQRHGALGRPPLDREHARDSRGRKRIDREPVQRVGGQRDQAAVENPLGRVLNRIALGELRIDTHTSHRFYHQSYTHAETLPGPRKLEGHEDARRKPVYKAFFFVCSSCRVSSRSRWIFSSCRTLNTAGTRNSKNLNTHEENRLQNVLLFVLVSRGHGRSYSFVCWNTGEH
jgi:hypothetical protein